MNCNWRMGMDAASANKMDSGEAKREDQKETKGGRGDWALKWGPWGLQKVRRNMRGVRCCLAFLEVAPVLAAQRTHPKQLQPRCAI